jgi:hypothetical protein
VYFPSDHCCASARNEFGVQTSDCDAGNMNAGRAHAPGTAIMPWRQVDPERVRMQRRVGRNRARLQGVEIQDSRAGAPSARQNACAEHGTEGEFSLLRFLPCFAFIN